MVDGRAVTKKLVEGQLSVGGQHFNFLDIKSTNHSTTNQHSIQSSTIVPH
jgi:hypothetical protein